MPADEPKQPPLEEVLSQYLSGDGKKLPSLKRLLAERPEVARQLREVLDEHQRSTALDQPTLMHGSGGSTPQSRHDAHTIPPQGSKASSNTSARALDPSATQFGDYELVEEIARGGMGVVYRARQISLDRIVAVKMILAGQLADQDDVARFCAEAESAARLSHRGIVPIFEVGEHEGQHFYAMGFVEGTSLEDRICEAPLSCSAAAELIRQVAVAIDFAHQNGVIHRDLKPANVLLDSSDQAHVTDFGLAKRIDRDSKLTQSGQVLGTPGYMPPEQASGQLDQVGPAADVYAIGAVLYATLTGRPPFQAASPVDALMQVMQRDPTPPRQLNSEIDRDLETICLKCLEKEANQRYASAGEVVAELERYERGEPLIARPVSARELLWRWHTRLRENKVVRVRSTNGIGSLPWVDIAIGPDPETGQKEGSARGVFAIGDTAIGVIACGDSAKGVVAIGNSCLGIISFGVRAIGLIAIGNFGIGLISISAFAIGLVAFGALSTGWVAVGGVAVGQYAFGAAALGQYALGIGRGDAEALQFFRSWLRLFLKGGWVVLALGILFVTFVSLISTRRKPNTSDLTSA